MAKYPLEFEYFTNQKKFEQYEKELPERIIKKYKPLFYQETMSVDQKSVVYRFIEDFVNTSKSVQDEIKTISPKTEILKIQKAQNILFKIDTDIKKFKLKNKYETKPYELREEYYNEYRPKLLKVLSIINKKYTPKVCEKYSKDIEKLYENEIKELEERNLKFSSQMQERLNSLNVLPPSPELKDIIKAQNEAIKDACDSMFPF